MKSLLLASLFSLLSLALAGCGPAVAPPVCTADTYPDEGFVTNAAAEIDLQARFEAVDDKISEGKTANPTAAQLEELFAAGTPSLRSVTTQSASANISEVFVSVERAANLTWTPADPPVGNGGVYFNHLYNARGLDLGELVEKLVFGGTHFSVAASLMTDKATVGDIDRMVALFGTTPAFPMAAPDMFAAKYAKKRTNLAATVPGPYVAIKAAFMNARAAVKGGSACSAERTAAFTQIRDQWERTLLGQAINYLNSAATVLARASAAETERAGALHQVGESLGFLRGLQTLPAQYRLITDAQLAEVLATLGGVSLDGSEAYRFVTDTNGTIDRLGTAVTQLQAARQFTPEEIATFKASF